jgi:hypothetical protein
LRSSKFFSIAYQMSSKGSFPPISRCRKNRIVLFARLALGRLMGSSQQSSL